MGAVNLPVRGCSLHDSLAASGSAGSVSAALASAGSGVEEAVPLLLPLQSLHSLSVHLHGQLFVALLLLLGGSSVLDPLDALLRAGEQKRPTPGAVDTRTCRSCSFSSFISFSFAFMVAWATRSFERWANELSPAVGRKGFRGACHCLPAPPSQPRPDVAASARGGRERRPFFLRPSGFGAGAGACAESGGAAAGGAAGSAAATVAMAGAGDVGSGSWLIWRQRRLSRSAVCVCGESLFRTELLPCASGLWNWWGGAAGATLWGWTWLRKCLINCYCLWLAGWMPKSAEHHSSRPLADANRCARRQGRIPIGRTRKEEAIASFGGMLHI